MSVWKRYANATSRYFLVSSTRTRYDDDVPKGKQNGDYRQRFCNRNAETKTFLADSVFRTDIEFCRIYCGRWIRIFFAQTAWIFVGYRFSDRADRLRIIILLITRDRKNRSVIILRVAIIILVSAAAAAHDIFHRVQPVQDRRPQAHNAIFYYFVDLVQIWQHLRARMRCFRKNAFTRYVLLTHSFAHENLKFVLFPSRSRNALFPKTTRANITKRYGFALHVKFWDTVR